MHLLAVLPGTQQITHERSLVHENLALEPAGQLFVHEAGVIARQIIVPNRPPPYSQLAVASFPIGR